MKNERRLGVITGGATALEPPKLVRGWLHTSCSVAKGSHSLNACLRRFGVQSCKSIVVHRLKFKEKFSLLLGAELLSFDKTVLALDVEVVEEKGHESVVEESHLCLLTVLVHGVADKVKVQSGSKIVAFLVAVRVQN